MGTTARGSVEPAVEELELGDGRDDPMGDNNGAIPGGSGTGLDRVSRKVKSFGLGIRREGKCGLIKNHMMRDDNGSGLKVKALISLMVIRKTEVNTQERAASLCGAVVDRLG